MNKKEENKIIRELYEKEAHFIMVTHEGTRVSCNEETIQEMLRAVIIWLYEAGGMKKTGIRELVDSQLRECTTMKKLGMKILKKAEEQEEAFDDFRGYETEPACIDADEDELADASEVLQ